MFRCHLTRKKLEAYQADELSGSEKGRVRAHLAECGSCERERLTLERLLIKLDELEGIKPSPGFEAAFRRRLREAGPGEPVLKPVRALRPAWASGMGLSFASAIILIVAGYLFWGTIQFPEYGGGLTVPVEIAEIDEDIDFYRDLELIEEMGDFVGPELPKDHPLNQTS